MSPSNLNSTFDFPQAKSKFFICAGINEPQFHKNSLDLAEFLLKSEIEFIHKTFDAEHSYEMWLTFYQEVLIEIYRKQ